MLTPNASYEIQEMEIESGVSLVKLAGTLLFELHTFKLLISFNRFQDTVCTLQRMYYSRIVPITILLSEH